MTDEKQKTVVIFEGLSSSGKTTLINHLKPIFEEITDLEIINKFYPENLAILYSENKLLNFQRTAFSNFTFRWTRLFLILNYIINSTGKMFFIDRGLLSTFIFGKLDNFPDNIQLGMISDIQKLLIRTNYKTIFLNCNRDIANNRIDKRLNIDPIKRKQHNEKFEPFFINLDQYDFLGELLVIDSSISSLSETNRIVEFIKSQENEPRKNIRISRTKR